MERICLECKHWHFFTGERDWSEVTPGNDWNAYCGMKHFDIDGGDRDTTEEAFRNMMLAATSCADFVDRKQKTPD